MRGRKPAASMSVITAATRAAKAGKHSVSRCWLRALRAASCMASPHDARWQESGRKQCATQECGMTQEREKTPVGYGHDKKGAAGGDTRVEGRPNVAHTGPADKVQGTGRGGETIAF